MTDSKDSLFTDLSFFKYTVESMAPRNVKMVEKLCRGKIDTLFLRHNNGELLYRL